MRLSADVESGKKAADSERSDSSLLSVLLFGFGNELGDILDRGAVVVVEAVALALDSCLVGQDSSVGCETRVGHVDVVVELDDLLYGSALLELGDCFFLNER